MEAIFKEIQATQAGIGYTDTEVQNVTSSAATFHVGTKRPNTRNIPNEPYIMRPCVFCEGSHFSNACVKVADTQKRRDTVKRDRLCFNCLKGNHSVRGCLAKGRCQKCQYKHHISLYDDKLTQSTNLENGVSYKQTSDDTHVKLTPTL